MRDRATLLRQALPVLMRVFAGQAGLKLRFGGQPRTDGRTVWVPPVPYQVPVEAASQLLDRYLAWLLHETGHCRFSDFERFNRWVAAQAVPLQGIAKALLNAVEDARTDTLQQRLWPGMRAVCDRVYAEIVGKPDRYDLGAHILAFLGVEQCGYGLLSDALERWRELGAMDLGPHFVDGLEALLRSVMPIHGIRQAEHVAETLLDFLAKQVPPQSTQRDRGGNDAGGSDTAPDAAGASAPTADDGASDGAASATGDAADDGTEDGAAAGGDVAADGGETPDAEAKATAATADGDADGAAGTDGASDPDARRASPEAVAKAFGDYVDTGQSPDIGKALRKGLERAIDTARRQGRGFSPAPRGAAVRWCFPEPDPDAYAALLAAHGHQAWALAARLEELLRAQQQCHHTRRVVGRRLAHDGAVRVVGGVPRLWRRRVEAETHQMGLMLVLDCSSSTEGDPIRAIQLAAIAFGEAFERCGLPVRIIGFNTDWSNVVFWDVKDWEMPMRVAGPRIAGLRADGGTPFTEAWYEAVTEAIEQMVADEEGRAVLTVMVTDAAVGATHVEHCTAGTEALGTFGGASACVSVANALPVEEGQRPFDAWRTVSVEGLAAGLGQLLESVFGE